jgi:acyl-coenzyme A thioesterase PaaI-like protein
MHAFDRATAIARTGDGTYTAELLAEWHGDRGGAHGGVLSAMLMRAILDLTAGSPLSPQSYTARFLRAPVPGPVSISATVERAGRRSATVSLRLSQDDRLCVLAAATLAQLTPGAGERSEAMPALPAHDAVPRTPRPRGAPIFLDQMDIRLAIGGPMLAGGDPVTGGWIQTAGEPHVLDAPFLVFLCDAWMPAAFFAATAPFGIPTLDLHVHLMVRLRDPRSAEPVAMRLTAENFRGGVFVEDAMVWSSSGELLAVSRQTALEIAPGE